MHCQACSWNMYTSPSSPTKRVSLAVFLGIGTLPSSVQQNTTGQLQAWHILLYLQLLYQTKIFFQATSAGRSLDDHLLLWRLPCLAHKFCRIGQLSSWWTVTLDGILASPKNTTTTTNNNLEVLGLYPPGANAFCCCCCCCSCWCWCPCGAIYAALALLVLLALRLLVVLNGEANASSRLRRAGGLAL